MDKYERCVMAVKAKGNAYNPWAVCTKVVGRMGGKPIENKTIDIGGRARRVYQGPRGGQFYIKNKKKVYI